MSLKTTIGAAVMALTLSGPFPIVSLVAGPAWAAPATGEEAQRLTTLFGRYLGKPSEGGSPTFSVSPDGEAYKVDVDPAALLAPLAGLGFSIAKTDHFVLSLTPRPDGTWQVKGAALPPIGFVKDGNTTTISAQGFAFDGVFDPKLATFASSTTTASGITTGSTLAGGSNTIRKTGALQGNESASDAWDGSVTVKASQTTQDMHYALTLKPATSAEPSQATPLNIEATAPRMAGDVALSHLPTAALLDVWAFLVAHPSRQEIAANQAELKSLLNAALAFDTKALVNSTSEKLTVNVPQGQFKADTASQQIELGGTGPDDMVSLGLKTTGLMVPPNLAPAWASGLVPKDVDLSVQVGPVHLHNALRKIVANADFSAEKPLSDDAYNEVVQAFADPLNVSVTLRPTTITTGLMSVKAEGSVHLGPLGGPVGAADIFSTGLDKAIAALQAGQQAEPEAGQALQFLMMAKQLAKPEPDGGYSWKLEAAAGAPIMVNGQSLTPTKPKKKQKSTP